MTSAEPYTNMPGHSLIPAYENDPLEYFKNDHEIFSKEDTPLHDTEITHSEPPPETSDIFLNDDRITSKTDTKLTRITKAKLVSGMLIGATFGALAFEQSPGNESVRATAAFEVLENTSDPIAAGGMVAGLTVVIEGVTGVLIAAGLNREKDYIGPKLEKFKDKIADEPKETDGEISFFNKAASSLTDTGITCVIGPGMVVARRHLQEPNERTFKKDVKSLTGYTAIGAGVSGFIGYLATGGVKHADKVGLEVPAEYFVDYATDWKFWTGLLALGYGFKYAKKGVSKATKLVQRNNKSDDAEENKFLVDINNNL